MTTNWLLRVGNGDNFKSSARYGIWGIQSTTNANKYFLKNAKPGDRLWFVKSKSHGKILGVATYRSNNSRNLDQVDNRTMTDEELGWTGEGVDWKSDTEVHYSNLHNLEAHNLLTHIKSPLTIRKYDQKCKVDLALEYSKITSPVL